MARETIKCTRTWKGTNLTSQQIRGIRAAAERKKEGEITKDTKQLREQARVFVVRQIHEAAKMKDFSNIMRSANASPVFVLEVLTEICENPSYDRNIQDAAIQVARDIGEESLRKISEHTKREEEK